MFKHILLPIDGSELSQKAIAAAIEFARTSGARLTPYMCVAEHPFPMSPSEDARLQIESSVRDRALAEIAKVESSAALAGTPCKGAVSSASAPYLGIIAKATELECDVIFMASHGRNRVSSVLLGSETQKVLSHSTIPVLVIR